LQLKYMLPYSTVADKNKMNYLFFFE